MIISHKYKFIFIRPPKIAGISMEAALAQHLGPRDIITEGSAARNFKDYYDHISPRRVKRKMGKKIWDSYFKFTVVRNPWDYLVSLYWHRFWWSKNKQKDFTYYMKALKQSFVEPEYYLMVLEKLYLKLTKPSPKDDFSKLIEHLPSKYTNTRYYFDSSPRPILDFYIRFENLENGYKKVCKKLRIPYKKLPRRNIVPRTDRRHYSKYYTDRTKALVDQKFKKEIHYFGYKFEEAK